MYISNQTNLTDKKQIFANISAKIKCMQINHHAGLSNKRDATFCRTEASHLRIILIPYFSV